ncbi:M23 family metallopeptidase [Pseudidiomarina terrestris]|uniref:M23 family metallopeptidase n=1 Tax=Pseudidiomarina terrestris TaxID=2820060 RepID=UPI0026548AA9|nr:MULTISPECIES: M23 family metallopeptidase [unclassified Pseudidiomarina]MDN7134369.1 peptidoglycan DD-metalloendopeptidase family protein [Pseudidiomarina sp. 1ASP75-5]MEA3587837.1 peptidoglycan DD-metalloendopeptidase family protein [Pseudidiomarina sp. 1APP75-27a]
MSLSVFYRGSKVKFGLRLSRRRLASLLGVVVLAGLAFSEPWSASGGVSADAVRSKITAEQIQLAAQSEAIQEIKADAEKKLTALTISLGEMRAKLRRLEHLGGRLADAAEIDASELESREQEVLAMGGPETSILDAPKLASGDVISDLESVLAQLEDKQKQLALLESVLMSHHISAESYVAGRPVDDGWLSSHYGVRKDPFNGTPTMHSGIDFANLAEDAGVFATGAGVVTWSGERYGYGKLVEIDHGGGLKTRYGHCAELLVKEGDVVTRGQQIAKLGSTGRSTGPHVHYEVLRNERQIDPSKYVYRDAR